MTTYNNVLGVFSYAAHTLANTLWSERAFRYILYHTLKYVTTLTWLLYLKLNKACLMFLEDMYVLVYLSHAVGWLIQSWVLFDS